MVVFPFLILKSFQILFKKVLKGEVTPDHLIRMNPEELASKELAAWRQRENRHVRKCINVLVIETFIFFPAIGEKLSRGDAT